MSIVEQSRRMGLEQNVSIRVVDIRSGKVVSEHEGHNHVTNSMLTGIAHYLKGDGIWNQGYTMLSEYVPKYMSLGTMGLVNQEVDEASGLPKGLISGAYQNQNQNRKTYEDLSQLQLAELLGPDGTIKTYDDDGNEVDLTIDSPISALDQEYLEIRDYISHRPGYGADGYDSSENNGRNFAGLGPPYIKREKKDTTVDCELISTSFPRALISYRDIIDESHAELPQTLDVVFSAMISVGALKQFRPGDQDYLFVTEAGLWSIPEYNDSGANGMLAGYRIMPSDMNTDWTAYAGNPGARKDLVNSVKRSIIKVGKNQVVQIVWKIQLGSLDQFGGLTTYKKYWKSIPELKNSSK